LVAAVGPASFLPSKAPPGKLPSPLNLRSHYNGQTPSRQGKILVFFDTGWGMLWHPRGGQDGGVRGWLVKFSFVENRGERVFPRRTGWKACATGPRLCGPRFSRAETARLQLRATSHEDEPCRRGVPPRGAQAGKPVPPRRLHPGWKACGTGRGLCGPRFSRAETARLQLRATSHEDQPCMRGVPPRGAQAGKPVPPVEMPHAPRFAVSSVFLIDAPPGRGGGMLCGPCFSVVNARRAKARTTSGCL